MPKKPSYSPDDQAWSEDVKKSLRELLVKIASNRRRIPDSQREHVLLGVARPVLALLRTDGVVQ